MKASFWKFHSASENEKGEIIIDVEPIFVNVSLIESVIPERKFAHLIMTSGDEYTVRLSDVVPFLKAFGAITYYGSQS